MCFRHMKRHFDFCLGTFQEINHMINYETEACAPNTTRGIKLQTIIMRVSKSYFCIIYNQSKKCLNHLF